MSADSTLHAFDRELRRRHGGALLVGVDEVGRGCLAGPVVACAAVSPDALAGTLTRIADSKTLTPARRDALRRSLRRERVAYALGWASAREIDTLNILRATFLAMRRAVERLSERCALTGALVVVDGPHTIPGIALTQMALVGGDTRSFAAACASVAAKTARDRWMRGLDRRYPGYGLAVHKGYGVPEHLAALSRLGPCALHRKSFAPVRAVARAQAAS